MNTWLWTVVLLSRMTAQASPAQVASDPATAREQRLEINGQLSVLADVLPRREAIELRPQAGIDATFRPSTAVRLKFDGFLEALAADRGGAVTDAIARAREAWVEVAGTKGDVRAGYGRVVWGRLDEIQPSDVINPLDTARYLFDGRSTARLPVAFVRGRLFASEGVIIESVVVPSFRRGTFDEMDEPTSPFNLLNDLVLPAGVEPSSTEIIRHEPEFSWKNMSGGGRLSATIGRVDLAAGAYRGFEGFGLISFEPNPASGELVPGLGPAVVGSLVQRFPRFTMVSADFETVTGDWAWRGEAAMFVEKTLQDSLGRPVEGQALDAGVGFDRRTGEFRIFASAVLHREWSRDGSALARTDVSVVGSIERQFRRERYLARAFAVVNPGDASAFVRGLIVWRVRDNMAVEGSAAVFAGEGDDALARFKTRDFLLARVRWRF